MHHSSKLIANLIHQFILLNFILNIRFNMYKHSWNVHDLYIHKMNENVMHLFIIDNDNQLILYPKYGYTISCTNFSNVFIKNRPHSLFLSFVHTHSDPFYNIFSFLGKPYQKLYSNIKSVDHDFFYPFHTHEWNFYLYPLITIHSSPPFQKKKYSKSILEMEIKKTLDLFYTEINKIHTQFNTIDNFMVLLKDWIEILVTYKSDFFQNSENNIPLLRKIFYQYLGEVILFLAMV